jgi:hypothetical protein
VVGILVNSELLSTQRTFQDNAEEADWKSSLALKWMRGFEQICLCPFRDRS